MNPISTSSTVNLDFGYLRLPDVLRVFPVSKSAWWAGVKSGRYPLPVKLSPRTSAWKVADIRALAASVNNAAINSPCKVGGVDASCLY